jgi:hypothetical protein
MNDKYIDLLIKGVVDEVINTLCQALCVGLTGKYKAQVKRISKKEMRKYLIASIEKFMKDFKVFIRNQNQQYKDSLK